MIALKSERGKGYAKEALKLVEAFAFVYYHKNEIIAKIKDDNEASMKLFEKSGYVFTNHS
jgi:diamine N-acetyltransferase